MILPLIVIGKLSGRHAFKDKVNSMGYELNDEERMIREFILQLKLGYVPRSYFQDKFGVNVQADAVLDGQHTFILIVDAETPS